MRFTGHFINLFRDWRSNELQITFAVNESLTDSQINEIKDVDKLDIKATKHREKRSTSANGLLWHCLNRIAAALNTDKWTVYLMMLKRYGKFTYIVVRESAVEAVKKQWRTSEVVGDVIVNGQKGVQMLCYYGSSTMNTKEFSTLLEGVISEMQEMGLQPPPSKDVQSALERYEEEWLKNQS